LISRRGRNNYKLGAADNDTSVELCLICLINFLSGVDEVKFIKVFVARRNYNYDEFMIIGIFTTKEAAKTCCDNDFYPIYKSEFQQEMRKMGYSYDVEEHELKEC
jgi:hypothetical protein